MKIFNLPDLGEGLQEAEIVEWRVRPGDEIAADATMVAVETDKAVVEIPAPFAGRVEKLYAAPGEVVRVGAPLIGFAGAAADTGTVVGELTPEHGADASTHAAAPAASGASSGKSAIRATPAVRALARSLGVDLAALAGSGPDGAITTADVQRAAQGAPQAAGGGEPLRGTRRAMAQRMAEAHAEVAAVSIFDDADVHAWPPQTPILARLLRALVAACRAEPALNAWFDGKEESRRVFGEVHVGIAVDTPDGLIVPVLRDAQALEASALERQARELIETARARTLPPERLRGATIALSNYGAIAGRYATPIVVPPTVAIVGAGRIDARPVARDDGTLVAHRLLPLSLSFDHRAVTGGEAARFLNALIADLQRAD